MRGDCRGWVVRQHPPTKIGGFTPAHIRVKKWRHLPARNGTTLKRERAPEITLRATWDIKPPPSCDELVFWYHDFDLSPASVEKSMESGDSL
jgi:hypothetical protein